MAESHPDYDHLWKDVITELFEEFLLFFSPELYELVDFTIPPAFLEQELHKINPESVSSNRVADKLVKLKLKSGKEQWVYVHVEIQGNHKNEFSQRMFQSFYRILDEFNQHVYALAIFTSNLSSKKLNSFHYDFFGTRVDYYYNTYRIASQSESELQSSNNPFALAILAGLYVDKSKKDNEMKYQYKRKLLRLLLQDTMKEKEANREVLKKLFIFIDHILRLPKQAEKKLVQELKSLMEKEDLDMGLSLEDTSFAKYFRKEGLEEGMEKGIEKGIEKGEKQKAIEIAAKLLNKGFSIEEVAEDTGLDVEEVKNIHNNK